jgi:acyl-CoA synthetase (AMP-forming)/AMP-acid ligase II
MPQPPADTLVELLGLRARDTPHGNALTFGGQPLTYEALWRRVNDFAAGLLRLGLAPGERVVMALPNGAEFFQAFYGAQRAGGVAVPMFPASGPERILRLAGLCGARFIAVPASAPRAQRAALDALAAAHGCRVLSPASAPAGGPPARIPAAGPHDLAYLQYTSGSTGDPKGVQLTSFHLLTNVRQMIAGMALSERDVFVSWLPAYHDMGLILMTMAPLYLGAELHLLPTNLKDVRPWLEAIQHWRGTFTAAPDYAYRLVLRQVAAPGDWDLSSLRVALNAAEPVRASTVRDFERAFGLCHVMTAGYGLAEATVGVSMQAPGTPARVDERGLVSVGRPFPGVQVQIVETPAGSALPPGRIGEIVVNSPANTTGYFNNPAATAALFWQEAWLRTGDLGYLDGDGRLFIAGRLKNILKRAGQTIYPQEVEEVVDRTPGVRYSAAVGIDRDGPEGEQIYVFAEARDGDALPEAARHALAVEIVAQVQSTLGIRPGRVFLVRPRSLPLTTTGKLQHGRLKEQYLAGDLRRQAAILYPEF